jgi:hypothetical protein
MQGTNMSNFVQATEHEFYMYAYFEYLDICRFLYLNTSRFELWQFYKSFQIVTDQKVTFPHSTNLK